MCCLFVPHTIEYCRGPSAARGQWRWHDCHQGRQTLRHRSSEHQGVAEQQAVHVHRHFQRGASQLAGETSSQAGQPSQKPELNITLDLRVATPREN